MMASSEKRAPNFNHRSAHGGDHRVLGLWRTRSGVAPGFVEKQNARAGGSAILGVGWRMVREWRRGEGRAFARSAGAGALALTRTGAGWITWRGGV